MLFMAFCTRIPHAPAERFDRKVLTRMLCGSFQRERVEISTQLAECDTKQLNAQNK